jgi:hypothetical protein
MPARADRSSITKQILFVLMLMLGGALSAGIAFAGAPSSSASPDVPMQVGATPTCEPDWSLTPISNPGTQSNALEDVAAISANEFWAVGSSANSGEPARTLIQRRDGNVWNQVPSPSQASSSYLKAVSVLSADDAWAVGHYWAETRWQSFIVHWDGTQWSSVPSPNVGERDNFLTGVVAVSTDDVWAVGYYYKISIARYQTLIMHWGGKIWSVVSSPNGFPFNHNLLYDVTAVSANDVWAVGIFKPNTGPTEEALTMHWDGTSWSVVPTPKAQEWGRTLNGVTAVAANDVWAVGYIDYDPNHFDFDTLILHWDGTQWTRVSSPTPTSSSELVEVAARSANDIWAVGRYSDASRTLIQHWDGTSWRSFPSPSNEENYNFLNGVAAAPGGNMMAVGTYTDYNFSSTLAMRYPGAGCLSPTPTTMPTSTPVPSCGPAWRVAPNPGDGEMMDISIISANDIWAVGYHSAETSTGGAERTYTMHWDGANWSVISSPNASTYDNRLNAVAAISPNDVWAVGSYKTSSADQTRPLFMHWDGATWSAAESTIWGQMHDVVALSSNDVWAVGFDYDIYNAASIYRWNGTSWNRHLIANISKDASSPLFGIAAVSSNDIWAVGSYFEETLIAHWDGAQWNKVPSPSAASTANRLNSVSAISSTDVWAVGYRYNDGLPVRTLIEHWDGTAWSVVPSPNATTKDNMLEAVAVAGPNDVWAVGNYFTEADPNKVAWPALIEHWNGSGWDIIPAPNPGIFGVTSLNGVSVVSPDDVWAVGKYENEGRKSLLAHYSEPPCGATATATATGTPTFGPSATATTATATPTATLTPNVTPTIGPPCGALPVNSSTSCTAPSTYNYSFTFYNESGCQSSATGSASLYFEAAPSASGPFTTLDTQGIPVTFPPGPSQVTFTGTLTETNIPSQYTVYRIGFSAASVRAGAYGQTQITPLCNTGGSTVTVTPGTPQPTTTTGTPTQATATRTSTVVTPTSCALQFGDVPPYNTFYSYVRCLVCRGIISGYNDGTFRPNNDITRGQIAKIVSQSAGFSDPAGSQIYEDVPPASPFYIWIQRLSNRGLVGGYPCGMVPEEPCVGPANRPYFRPNASATRGQLSKIVASARGLTINPTAETYQDVSSTHTFYVWIEQLSNLGVMGGYPCGTVPTEPCGTTNKPYFRPANNVTRGQASKIVANTFFPNCQTPEADLCESIPPSVDMEITPDNCQVAGARFDFVGSGFQPGESIIFYLTDPSGQEFGGAEQLIARPDGTTEPVAFQTQADFPTGRWTLTMQGESSGHEARGYFGIYSP